MKQILKKIIPTLFYPFLLVVPLLLVSQTIDLEKLADIPKAKPFGFNGNLSANALFYKGSQDHRDPFTYYFQGGASVTLFEQLQLPFSFSFTNYGSDYTYPTLPNRFSIHPTYKGYTAHIGEVVMSYSPYTLNGLPFMGTGFDAKVGQTPLKVSMVYGRLHKSIAYDTLYPDIYPMYKRMGYGGKISFEKGAYSLALTLFGAKDQINSLAFPIDSFSVYPQQNLAASIEGRIQLVQNLNLNLVLASSGMVNDIRDKEVLDRKRGVFPTLYHPQSSIRYFNALQTGITYAFLKTTIGLNYERVDPEYQTLGAYYFTQDLERIALNASQNLWKDKASLSGSFGFEHDNLDNTQFNNNKRFAYSLGANLNLSERLQMNVNYSNFSSFVNIRSPFEDLNNITNIQRIDTIDYKQVSQNAGISAQYLLKKSETQNQSLNLNFSFQDAFDEQSKLSGLGGTSYFYTTSGIYSSSFTELKLTISLGYNASYNIMGKQKNLTSGPMLSASYTLFKKLNTGCNISYNNSLLNGEKQTNIWNIRFNAGYSFLKRHTINLSLSHQSRSNLRSASVNDFIGSFGYSFSFK